MNERLKEIAIQAKVEHCVSHVRLQEFAELIILECCKISDDIEALELPWKTSTFIKEHFEVK